MLHKLPGGTVRFGKWEENVVVGRCQCYNPQLPGAHRDYPSPHPVFLVSAPTYLSQQHLGSVPVGSALVDQAYSDHGSHLDVVGDIQLRGGGWQQGGDVDAQQAGDGHVHGAQLGSGDTEQKPNTRHLMALGKETRNSEAHPGMRKPLSPCSSGLSQQAVCRVERSGGKTAGNL